MKRKEWQTVVQLTALVTQLGLTMVGSVVVAFFMGRWIDRLLGLTTVFTLIFLLLGVASGFYSAYRLIMETTRSKKDG